MRQGWPFGVTRIMCHFGEWLQGRMGPDGPVVLVTLPCRALVLSGWLGGAGIGVQDRGQRLVSAARLRRLRAAAGLRAPERWVVLRAPVAPGLGAGLSTAALVAMARLSGWQGNPFDLARACVAVEGASDPLMFAQADRLLWASRQGRVLGVRRQPMPAFTIVGGFWGPPQVTDARDDRFPDIADLAARWQRSNRLADLAEIATDSALRTQALRGPQHDPTADLARDLGALGWQRAHTGAARGLIFAPGTVPPHAAAMLRETGMRGVLRFGGGG